jgi:hypothetical protein
MPIHFGTDAKLKHECTELFFQIIAPLAGNPRGLVAALSGETMTTLTRRNVTHDSIPIDFIALGSERHLWIGWRSGLGCKKLANLAASACLSVVAVCHICSAARGEPRAGSRKSFKRRNK